MTPARYDAVADFYASGFGSAGDPATRALLDLLGPVAGLRVLDVACGHGRITRALARRGAQVTGVDISGNLIGKARKTEQDERLGIRYLHADIAAPGVLGPGGFDAAGRTAARAGLGPGPRRRPQARLPRRQVRQTGAALGLEVARIG